MSEQGHAAAGWYPDPTMAGTQRYWDGGKWTDHVAPLGPAAAAAPAAGSSVQKRGILAVILAGSVIGLVMAMQSASLLSGTGSLWTGVAIGFAAAIAAWVMRSSVPLWVRIVVVLTALLGLANTIYVEVQLEEKREDLGNFLD